MYEEQHQKMEKSGTSFLDSIRDEAFYWDTTLFLNIPGPVVQN